MNNITDLLDVPDVEIFDPDAGFGSNVGEIVFGVSAFALQTGHNLVQKKLGPAPRVVSIVWEAQASSLAIGASLAASQNTDVSAQIASIVAGAVGGYFGGPIGAYVAAEFVEFLAKPPPSSANGLTLYAADGYYGLEFQDSAPYSRNSAVTFGITGGPKSNAVGGAAAQPTRTQIEQIKDAALSSPVGATHAGAGYPDPILRAALAQRLAVDVAPALPGVEARPVAGLAHPLHWSRVFEGWKPRHVPTARL